MEDINELILQRMKKLEQLKEEGINPFPNDFKVTCTVGGFFAKYDGSSEEELLKIKDEYRLAGRIIMRRDFGKAVFFHFQDRSGRLQGYLRKDIAGEDNLNLLKKLDIGDIVGITGTPFKTKTGELSLLVTGVKLLAKSLRPLPEKWHGLTDIEARYRQRYLDLIVNPKVKEIFVKRAKILSLIREFFIKRDYIEVETPMMQPVPGGAAAKPFKTYHNALDMELFLRIAPELYLKRLVVGGFERVFEINRNFRNEGISTQHNPEFTMIEFYQAYATYHDLMALTEELINHLAVNVCGGSKILYQGVEIDLASPWERLTVRDAVVKYAGLPDRDVDDIEKLKVFANKIGLEFDKPVSYGKLLTAVFECAVENKLIQPTFITEYPVEVSPLSMRNVNNPFVTDRFELFIFGREIANAFSELNDPVDQKGRFMQQLEEREKGDEEAHQLDEDFIRALEYGMPPTAGEGIGIDRLVMLLTDCPSIRDVILFPLLRGEL